MEKFVWLERGVCLLETVIVLPIFIVIVSIVTIKESQRKRGSKV
jgi:Flp pilus assembly protein TadG